MGLVDKAKKSVGLASETHDFFYQLVAQEFQEGKRDGALYLKALQEAGGNEERANGIYIGLRVAKVERQAREQHEQQLLEHQKNADLKQRLIQQEQEKDRQRVKEALSTPEHRECISAAINARMVIKGFTIVQIIIVNTVIASILTSALYGSLYSVFAPQVPAQPSGGQWLIILAALVAYIVTHGVLVFSWCTSRPDRIQKARQSLALQWELLEIYASLGDHVAKQIVSIPSLRQLCAGDKQSRRKIDD